MNKRFKVLNTIISFILVMMIPIMIVYGADEASLNYNRYNVVIAMDASNSINYTDKERLRDDAAEQFIGLLAENGNMLGGVVFSDKVEEKIELKNMSTEQDKKTVTDFFKKTQTYMYTNIGAAIDESVNMIQNDGNSELPSVIVLLSDGNTEMDTEEKQTAALELKADAIQRARESGIKIYTVCLNANSKADVSEMQQISSATGGEFQEVKNADDLKKVFNDFYNLIYGTSTIEIIDETFPSDGMIEKEFYVPGIGVEEVNIVLYGHITNIEVKNPSGNICSDNQVSTTQTDTFSLVKIRDAEMGMWKLIVSGNPGDEIKVNMLYNTNLVVKVTELENGAVYVGKNNEIIAQLCSGDIIANSKEQYNGFEATLELCDIDGNVLESIPMQVTDRGFVVNYAFENTGVYFYRAHVVGNYLEKTSGLVGPIQVVDSEAAVAEVNTAPAPVKDKVKEKVYIWPFKGGSFTYDLNNLAKDTEDKSLAYEIVSSSFIEGKDYSVDDGMLLQEHFSLSRGSYTVRAMDSGGLTCEIELEVTTVNVGIMVLIGIAIIILIVLVAFGISLYIALSKPFGGPIFVQAYVDGQYSETVKREKKRGRCKLSVFGLPSIGINYADCYFQATGQPYIELITKKPVYYGGKAVTKVRVESGAETVVTADQEGAKKLYIRYSSRLRNRRTGRSRI